MMVVMVMMMMRRRRRRERRTIPKKMLQIFSNINSNRFPPPQHYHIFVGDLKHKKI